MKKEFYESSRKCAGINIAEELGRAPGHPIEALRDAYGLHSE